MLNVGVTLVTGFIFVAVLHLLERFPVLPYYDGNPNVRVAWWIFLIVCVVPFVLLEKSRSSGLRGIEKWRHEKSTDRLVESNSVFVLLGGVLGVLVYALI